MSVREERGDKNQSKDLFAAKHSNNGGVRLPQDPIRERELCLVQPTAALNPSGNFESAKQHAPPQPPPQSLERVLDVKNLN